MTTDLLAPAETETRPTDNEGTPPSVEVERMGKPFRLGLAGVGTTIALFGRLAAANGFGDIDKRPLLLAMAAASALVGLGLVLTARRRDRFGPPLFWITAITTAAWATLNWISPPFDPASTVWSTVDQTSLAVLGAGNGLLLSGIVALAFVRRTPTLTVASTLIAAVTVMAANTVLLRVEWGAIGCHAIAFALILLAWDRSPRYESRFEVPAEPPRVSRAALSFASVALCGTALQLWVSRDDIPRAIPAVLVAVALIAAAFASLVRVRREIERRETTLSEWTSWIREIRRSDFRAEMQNFEPGTVDRPDRALSFPDLRVPDPLGTPVPKPGSLGAETVDSGQALFGADELSRAAAELGEPGDSEAMMDPSDPIIEIPSAVVAPGWLESMENESTGDLDAESLAATGEAVELTIAPDPIVHNAPSVDNQAGIGETGIAETGSDDVDTMNDLERWLASAFDSATAMPLITAVESMSLDEFEALPEADAATATEEIASFLADEIPSADIISWMDGPYFLVGQRTATNSELAQLNTHVSALLSSTQGTVAFVRPKPDATLDEVVDAAVVGLLRARQHQQSGSRPVKA